MPSPAGFRYKAAKSRALSMNCGSAYYFHVSTRCGFKPKARQIRENADGDIPVAAAMERVDQCVSRAPFLQGLGITNSTCSSVIFRRAPGCSSSPRPSSRDARNRPRRRRRRARSATAASVPATSSPPRLPLRDLPLLHAQHQRL